MWLWGADSLGGSSGLTQPPIFSRRRLFCIFQRKDFIFLRDLLVSKVILQKMMMSHIHLLSVNTGLPCCAQGQAWSLFSWRSWFSSDFSYDQHFQNDSIWCKREHGAFFWGGDTKVDAKHFGEKKKRQMIYLLTWKLGSFQGEIGAWIPYTEDKETAKIYKAHSRLVGAGWTSQGT